jgi:hypothetical protein
MLGTKAKRTDEEKEMNTAREQSMKTFEDMYAEPPPYSPRPSSSTTATSRTVPASWELNFKPSPLEIPTPAECITHLKLLHAFAKLRHDIGNHENLYGIRLDDEQAKGLKSHLGGSSTADSVPQFGGPHEEATIRAEIESHVPAPSAEHDAGLAERVRDKRWSIFVTKAVARFEKWWDMLRGKSTWYRHIRTDDFEASSTDLYAGESE